MMAKKTARRDKAASSSLQLVKAETQETMAQLCSAFLEGEIVELDPETVVKEELEETAVACPGFAFLAQCARITTAFSAWHRADVCTAQEVKPI